MEEGRAAVLLGRVAGGTLAETMRHEPPGHQRRTLPGAYEDGIWAFYVSRSRGPVWPDRLWGIREVWPHHWALIMVRNVAWTLSWETLADGVATSLGCPSAVMVTVWVSVCCSDRQIILDLFRPQMRTWTGPSWGVSNPALAEDMVLQGLLERACIPIGALWCV